MAIVVSHHNSDLGLPLGGPVLRPGVPTPVERWAIIKGHPVVKSWLAAKAIEVVEDDVGTAPAAPPAPETSSEPHPLDHDGDGHPGGSLPVGERGLEELRARYTQLFGSEPDGRWGEKRLQDAIDAKQAE
ncbi:MAG: hypothetical protein J0H34_22420 [Rhizobiales bacterium]|nr:hypothetical protein [Hyphomicrobiales bacterium]